MLETSNYKAGYKRAAWLVKQGSASDISDKSRS